MGLWHLQLGFAKHLLLPQRLQTSQGPRRHVCNSLQSVLCLQRRLSSLAQKLCNLPGAMDRALSKTLLSLEPVALKFLDSRQTA